MKRNKEDDNHSNVFVCQNSCFHTYKKGFKNAIKPVRFFNEFILFCLVYQVFDIQCGNFATRFPTKDETQKTT